MYRVTFKTSTPSEGERIHNITFATRLEAMAHVLAEAKRCRALGGSCGSCHMQHIHEDE